MHTQTKNHPDNLPIPPAKLTYFAAGEQHADLFLSNGELGAECIRNILKKNNLDISNFSSTLDFGCGCGRIIRHWHNLSHIKLSGVDYNPFLVRWCQANLKFASFKTNRLYKEIEYKNEEFDFIYAISTFAHLTEFLQYFWLGELKRILKPDGLLLISAQGTKCIQKLSYEEKKQFKNDQFVIRKAQHAGTNLCWTAYSANYTYHMLDWIGLTPVDFVPGGSKDTNQDLFLIKKTN